MTTLQKLKTWRAVVCHCMLKARMDELTELINELKEIDKMNKTETILNLFEELPPEVAREVFQNIEVKMTNKISKVLHCGSLLRLCRLKNDLRDAATEEIIHKKGETFYVPVSNRRDYHLMSIDSTPHNSGYYNCIGLKNFYFITGDTFELV